MVLGRSVTRVSKLAPASRTVSVFGNVRGMAGSSQTGEGSGKNFAWREFFLGGGALGVGVGLFNYVFPNFDDLRDKTKDWMGLYSPDTPRSVDIRHNIPPLLENLKNEDRDKVIVRDRHKDIFTDRDLKGTSKLVLKGSDYSLRRHILNYGVHSYLQGLRAKDKPTTVVVLDGSNWENLQRDYDSLCRELRVPVDTLSLKERREEVSKQLKLRGDWVIIFDNVRERYNKRQDNRGFASVDDYVPEVELSMVDRMFGHSSSGIVVIVPNCRDFENDRDKYSMLDLDNELYGMNKSAAMKLAQDTFGRGANEVSLTQRFFRGKPIDKLEPVVEELEYIPSCIRGAAGLVNRGKINVSDYVSELSQKKKIDKAMEPVFVRAARSHYAIAQQYMSEGSKELFRKLLSIGGDVDVKSLKVMVGKDYSMVETYLKELVDLGFVESGDKVREAGYRVIDIARKTFIDDEITVVPKKDETEEESHSRARNIYLRDKHIDTVQDLNNAFTANNPDREQKRKNQLLLPYVDRVIGTALDNMHFEESSKKYYGTKAKAEEVEKIARLMDSAANYYTSQTRNYLTAHNYLLEARGLIEDRAGIDRKSKSSASELYKQLREEGRGIEFVQAYARVMYSYGRLYVYTKGQKLGDMESGDITISSSRDCFEIARELYEEIFKSKEFKEQKRSYLDKKPDSLEEIKKWKKTDDYKRNHKKVDEYYMEHMLSLRSGTYQVYSKDYMNIMNAMRGIKKLRDEPDGVCSPLLDLKQDGFHQSQCNYLLAKCRYQVHRHNLPYWPRKEEAIKEALDDILKAIGNKDKPKDMILLAKIILESGNVNIKEIKEKLKTSDGVRLLIKEKEIEECKDSRDLTKLICKRLEERVRGNRYKHNLIKIRKIEGRLLMRECKDNIRLSDKLEVCRKSGDKFDESIKLQRHSILRSDKHPSMQKSFVAREEARRLETDVRCSASERV